MFAAAQREAQAPLPVARADFRPAAVGAEGEKERRERQDVAGDVVLGADPGGGTSMTSAPLDASRDPPQRARRPWPGVRRQVLPEARWRGRG